MIMANSGATSGWYHDFLETPVQLRVGTLEINKNMLLWINDALMAVFFLLVGLEVKRELMQGSLASLRQAAFPVIAAIGGMIVPALLYLAFNYADPITREGWAIPAATDIAFALGVLALLGSRVPLALKIFLMALAIIDDLGAIIIIALFYTNDLSMASLALRRGCSNCGTRGIESVWCTPHGRLYSGWRGAVDSGVEIRCPCNAGWRHCRLLYSVKREAWALSG
ncbi:hypothetical protein EIMP300_82600 [Escherichia coli]|uniref:Na+/H+ antiporter NhaA n=1 Tax=Escherichia coli TaxID=562 RepID=A0A8S0G518_ECOLX|nr:hypothetical protein EIMP300_82600 [Escherichia coli]